MAKIKDLTNQKFNKLAFIKYLGNNVRCGAIWLNTVKRMTNLLNT
jgi:hypothetical protein